MANLPAELEIFVRAALARGLPRSQIRAALEQADWPQEGVARPTW